MECGLQGMDHIMRDSVFERSPIAAVDNSWVRSAHLDLVFLTIQGA